MLGAWKYSRSTLLALPFVEEFYAESDRTGQTIRNADAMIAATASRYGLGRVTENTNHYQRIPTVGFALEIDNWRR
jgi:predicted nucleic acid-binding protein